MALFQSKVLNKYISNLNQSELSDKWEVFKNHFQDPDIQNNIRNSKEEQYQEGFLIDLFVKVLNYTKNPNTNYNLTTEYKNIKDSKKADGAIIVDEKVKAVIELKGTNITDLDKIENQAFGYKNNQQGCKYVITSNFEKLRFYIDNAVEFIEFNLFTLTKEDFYILYVCLEFTNISKDIPAKIKSDSNSEEEAITKKLYVDYTVFKKDLFQNLVSLNPDFDSLTLFKKSQKLLDRFLFLFFAEDRDLLPANSVRLVLNDWKDLKDRDEDIPLYDRFKKYFEYLNTGFKGKRYDVYPYNGGLFKTDEVLDNIKINDEILYNHTLNISNYDFVSEVDVNILGHIFENSLNELEEIEAEIKGADTDRAKTKRKKDGVFYTPKYITKYIVENTVGKLCIEKKDELKIIDEEYVYIKNRSKSKTKLLADKLNDYRKWLLQITICDPACGSGAFLNQALDFLIKEHSLIDELQAKLFGDAFVLSDVEKSILENNLFGVDLNEESVEIAKLSLWLRTAQKNRKLNDLSSNIKCGNSVIDDPEITNEKAFKWQKEFPHIFIKGGFDVIIGNPPYVSIKEIPSSQKQYFKDNFSTAQGQFDLYGIFIQHSYNILKDKGIFSFITSSTFISNKDFIGLRKFLLTKTNLHSIINLGETVFKDANLDVAILAFEKQLPDINNKILIIKDRYTFDLNESTVIKQSNYLNELNNFEFKINCNNSDFEILNKVYENSFHLGDILFLPRGIEIGGNSEKISNDSSKSKIIFGRNIDRYLITFDNNFIEFENDLSVFKSLEIYTQPKILIQRIRNLSLQRRIVATYDEDGYLCTNTLRIGNLKDNSYDLKYLLACLNSTLINYLFSKYFLNKDIYAYQLQLIPIKKILLSQQDVFSSNASLLLLKNKELFQIIDSVLGILKSKFPIDNPSRSLQSWHTLDFKGFLKELKKVKVSLTLPEEAEWMVYFNAQKEKAQNLKGEIEKADRKIDQMVYELYGLTEEEIKIVENSYN